MKNIEYAVHQTIEGFKAFNNQLIIDEKLLDIQINNKKFKGYNSSITLDGMTANYESYLGNYDNFNLIITISYQTEIEEMELLEIVRGIKTCS